MPAPATIAQVRHHLARLQRCRPVSAHVQPVVVGRPVASRIILVGQAPGDKEPKLGRPFAWTAGQTLSHGSRRRSAGRRRKRATGSTSPPSAAVFPARNRRAATACRTTTEIANCAHWLEREFSLLRPRLVIPVGRLAITQFLGERPLTEVVGRSFRVDLPRTRRRCPAAAASLGRVAMAPHGAGQDVAPAGACAGRRASGRAGGGVIRLSSARFCVEKNSLCFFAEPVCLRYASWIDSVLGYEIWWIVRRAWSPMMI